MTDARDRHLDALLDEVTSGLDALLDEVSEMQRDVLEELLREPMEGEE